MFIGTNVNLEMCCTPITHLTPHAKLWKKIPNMFLTKWAKISHTFVSLQKHINEDIVKFHPYMRKI
jgi:hypothetical protein